MARKRTHPGSVERRTVLRGLATGLAGAVAAPGGLSTAQAAETAGSTPATRPQPAAAGEPASIVPEQDRETLESLCGLLVPGSVDAGVPDLVGRVAAVEGPDHQAALLTAIRAFEGQARASHGSRWIDLDERERLAILDRAASGEPPPLRRALVHLRDLAATAYFSTEPGMRRLGWTGRNAWRELPTCDHTGDDHQQPDQR